MDVVLEVFDALFLDRVYSTLFPASSSSYASQFAKDVVTSTFSSMREMGTSTPQHEYIYKPASRYLNLGTNQWTHSSTLPRDNSYRQALSLGLITW